jgi:hypothetical protein
LVENALAHLREVAVSASLLRLEDAVLRLDHDGQVAQVDEVMVLVQNRGLVLDHGTGIVDCVLLAVDVDEYSRGICQRAKARLVGVQIALLSVQLGDLRARDVNLVEFYLILVLAAHMQREECIHSEIVSY